MKGLGLSMFLAVVLIGALGALFLEDVLVTPVETRRADSGAPVYFFEDFTMRVMNEHGRPAYVLTGAQLLSYRDDHVDAQIESPRLAIDAVAQPDWDVTARTGSLVAGGDLLQLRGDVVLQQVGADLVEPLRIETQTLDLDTVARIATTPAEVHISAPQWRVRSLGMQARIDEGLVDLLAAVHGRYMPQAPAP